MNRELIPYLKLIHASFNTAVLMLFIYHGSNGLKIRKNRKAGSPDFKTIKRHRNMGPVLAAMGAAGFFAGLTVTYMDLGRLLVYMPHLINGTSIVFLTTVTFFISRYISASGDEWRTVHSTIGIFIICLYLLQAFLGIGILL